MFQASSAPHISFEAEENSLWTLLLTSPGKNQLNKTVICNIHTVDLAASLCILSAQVAIVLMKEESSSCQCVQCFALHISIAPQDGDVNC